MATRFRETLIKKNSLVYVQVSRVLIEEFDNGRKDVQAQVTEDDARQAATFGILSPVTISQDTQKRTDDQGRPMVNLHDGARRVTMALMAAETMDLEGSPLMIDGEVCIPARLDNAKNYKDPKHAFERQLILNSGENWTDSDLSDGAVYYIDTLEGTAEAFATAYAINRVTVQRYLKVGRVEGLAQAMRDGHVKNMSVAYKIAQLLDTIDATLEDVLEVIKGMKQTADGVAEAIQEAFGNDDAANQDSGPDAGKEESNDKEDAGSQDGGSDAGKSESYSFCRELAKLNQQVQDRNDVTLLTKAVVGMLEQAYNDKDDVLVMLSNLMALEADRDNLMTL